MDHFDQKSFFQPKTSILTHFWQKISILAKKNQKIMFFHDFYMFRVLENSQKGSLNAKYTKYAFLDYFGPFLSQKLTKMDKNKHFSAKNGVFLTFFPIFATYMSGVFHREHIGYIIRPF